MPGQLQITPFCAPQQMDDENPLISAGLRAVIQSPLRCGSYGPLSRLTVFLSLSHKRRACLGSGPVPGMMVYAAEFPFPAA